MAAQWTKVADDRLERELEGSEYIVNLTDVHNSGNYQLVFCLTLECNIPHNRLVQRFGPAWFRLRQEVPLIGVEYPKDRLHTASYTLLQDTRQTSEWIANTTEVIHTSEPVSELGLQIAQSPLQTSHRMAKMYLVLGPKDGQAGVIIHTTHVLTGPFSMQNLDRFVAKLVDDDTERGLEHVFTPEVAEDIAQRAPSCLEVEYRSKFKPTDEDVANEMHRRSELALLEERKPRIGFPLHPLAHERPSRMNTLDASILHMKSIITTLRQAGVTPTAAFFACIVTAMGRYHKAIEQERPGCMLNFSTHASRWLPCHGQNGAPLISMAIVPGAAWIQPDAKLLAGNGAKETLISLAKVIGTAQNAFLSSPHTIAYAGQAARTIRQAVDSGTMSPQPATLPSLSNPVLTSQGTLPFTDGYQSGSSSIRSVRYHYRGRNTDPCVCFALYSTHGEMRASAMFDEKFFEVGDVQSLLTTAVQFFQQFGEQQPMARM